MKPSDPQTRPEPHPGPRKPATASPVAQGTRLSAEQNGYRTPYDLIPLADRDELRRRLGER